MKRRRNEPWEPQHRASVRHRVAVEAARMLYHREVKEYYHAKREAARRQGTAHLPANAEVHAQLLLIARRVDGDAHLRKLGAMRQAALELMELLEPFSPRLIGSVLTGHIRKGSDIDLHLYNEDVEAICEVLAAAGHVHEVETVHTRKGGEPRDFVHVRLGNLRGFEVEITLYPPEALHIQPRCGITGGAMRRASLAELRRILAAEAPAAGPSSPRLAPPIDRDAVVALIPELLGCRGVLQNHYHHLDVLDHTWAVVDGIERMHREHWRRFKRPELSLHMGDENVSLLLLAALCHDLGKPATQSFSRDGRIRFIGHDAVGADMAEAIATRLGMDRASTEALAALVGGHLEAVRIPSEDGAPSRIHRLFREAGDHLPELALLSLADVEAARGPAQNLLRIEEHERFVGFLLDQYFDGGFVAHPVLPVSSTDLRETFGALDAGLEERLLDWLMAGFLDGEFEGREEGLSLASEFLEGGG
jgi:putative nucleotidyltransferase with HDIG domain